MRPTFENTVDILVKAYLNDTLQHGNDCACAVGNLICAANGLDPKINWHPKWHKAFRCGGGLRYREEGKKEVRSTGYSVTEIIQIEKAFEGADDDGGDDEWMFNGLMAVVDVLASIHNIDLSQKEEAKKLFVK